MEVEAGGHGFGWEGSSRTGLFLTRVYLFRPERRGSVRSYLHPSRALTEISNHPRLQGSS